MPVSRVGTAQPQTSFHTGLVQLVSATVAGKAQVSSGYLFKASFCQLFGALKSHISTPGDAGAQPSLSRCIPGCSPCPTSSSPGCFHPRAPLTQGADSIHNHLGQNAPKQRRDESSCPCVRHPWGWGRLLCVKGFLCRAGGRQQSQPQAVFANCGAIRSRLWQQEGPHALPPCASGPEMAMAAERAVGICWGVYVPAAEAGLAGGGHMARSSVPSRWQTGSSGQSLSLGRAAVPSTGSGTGAGRLPGTLRCCGRLRACGAAWPAQQDSSMQTSCPSSASGHQGMCRGL